jgi:hypothetical protein
MPLQAPRKRTPERTAELQKATAPQRMAQFDALPKAARDVINDLGGDAWRAILHGVPPSAIRAQADDNGGRFVL